MDVQLIHATADDVQRIWEMQVTSFSPLLDKYQDFDISPASELVKKVAERMKRDNSYYYFIQAGGDLVGVIRVIDDMTGQTPKWISPLFVLPEYQNRGYGQKAIAKAEELHGSTNWQLETILQEKGNLHLYEKMGYRQTGETKVINDKMTLVFYEKD